MEDKKIIYYQDELNDEFSTAKIIPRKIDENYKYEHGILWEMCSYFIQNVISMPIKVLYKNIKFKHKYIGKEKFKTCKKQGYFIYANHTQAFADTFLPSVGNYPKRNFLIVNPANVSMKDNGVLVEMLGAIPTPDTKAAMKKFLKVIEKDVSFKYPVQLKVPAFSFTNTYQSYGKNNDKVKIVTYIDGPFYPNELLTMKEQQKDLRDRVYNCMVDRSKNSNIEYIKYIKKEEETAKK